ncbi:MAG: transcriptional regulator GutM [Lachnospiraceae bacterium]|nr:transcriptional regulator GutM [Lachnospiraceae bacterium]MDY5496735.1 transcriptional regulator GutM [Anaerobutyricum sp.]
MFKLIVVVALAFALQFFLTSAQMSHFNKEFIKLRKQGRVACGRKSGGFHAGAIVMFQIDDNGIVQQAKKLEGVTCLARVRDLNGFEGRFVGDLTEEDGPKNHRNLKKAIADAALTYNKFVRGEELEQPPSPFQKIGRSAKKILHT